MRSNVIALIGGVIFGFGLTLSDMINPKRVIGFLDISGNWDPTLAFVMGGALAVTIPVFFFVLRRKKPICAEEFHLSNKVKIDQPLIIGSVLFGIGWGLSGVCPGPAVAALAFVQLESMIFFISMLAGMVLFDRWPLIKS